MKRFLLSKPGLSCILLFTIGIGFLCQRIAARAARRQNEETSAQVAPVPMDDKTRPALSKKPLKESPEAGTPSTLEKRVQDKPSTGNLSGKPETKEHGLSLSSPTKPSQEIQEDLSTLDRSKALEEQSRQDKDRLGRGVTRRRTPAAHPVIPPTNQESPAPAPLKALPPLRLSGQGSRALNVAGNSQTTQPSAPQTDETELRFCPYGRPIKCELVFTVDSANLGTPIIAMVMEPIYNNGQLVIPAGTELHGTARVETLRDRICSTESWTMVLPREMGRPNGRQLLVRGDMLDRDEPDTNGMTWGILDGSFGLRGQCIRTMEREEIERFVATFMGGAVSALEQRQSYYNGEQHLVENGRNAALSGLASNMRQLVDEITQEIEKNGAFIRVGGGKQFYFYPKQAILPEEARVPETTRERLAEASGKGLRAKRGSNLAAEAEDDSPSPGKTARRLLDQATSLLGNSSPLP